MSTSFNLVDEAWIPVIATDGDFLELSLRDMLAYAPDLHEISCETAIQSTAILPLVLAILHRVFGPPNLDVWKALWEAGEFDMSRLDEYFARWRERFDLFHAQRPFLQMPDARVDPKSLIHLIHPMGNTGTLFSHVSDDSGIALSPAAAARYLLTARCFKTAGPGPWGTRHGPGFTDSIFARGVMFWACGTTLFETLLLNLVQYPDENGPTQHTDSDAPAWEMDDLHLQRELSQEHRHYLTDQTDHMPNIKKIPETPPLGYLDYLTWSNNRMQLIPELTDNGALVREAVVAPAINLSADVRSPQRRYIQREKKGEISYSFLYFNADKALWRDYDSLLKRETVKVFPPAVVEWLAELTQYEILDSNYPIRLIASGMLADQAKTIFYRQEIMPLPLDLLRDEDRIREIRQAIAHAEDCAAKLHNALNMLAEHVLQRGADGKPDNANRNSLVKQWNARERYWIALEPIFWRFIETLVEDSDEAMRGWGDSLRGEALGALRYAANLAGDSPWALKGGIYAERYLRRELNELLNE